MLAGKLRIGLAEQSVLIALAHASVQYHKLKVSSNESGDLPEVIMKSAFNSLPNYEIIIPKLLQYGIYELPKHCGMIPGIPLKPMLAHPTKSLCQVLDRFENLAFSCEYKYDGERAQIHRLSDGKCFVYSRNSENMSQKYPDIMEKLSLIVAPDPDPPVKTESFILDCEVVAWDATAGKILPFQILSTRKRKDVTVDSVQVQVVLFAFDLLYLNGESLLRKSLRERRALLHSHFREVPNEFYFAKSIDSTSVEDIQIFLDEAVQSSCEGLMVKTLDEEASYEPSKRSRNWLKVKKDYLDGIGDSLDLVVMGGYVGRGKRTGGYGGFLLGCYDPDNEEYQVICKLGTGFSEADLERMTAELKPHVLLSGPKPYYRSGESVKPDVWFDSVCVWEVKAADFSISPIYTAAWGIIEPSKGISLRFPRYIRDRTGEKGPEDATTSQQVAELYEQQALAANSTSGQVEEDDYY
jgi:DNA ligase 1